MQRYNFILKLQMKVYEILSLAPEILKTLHKSGIKADDYRWIDLYRDYREMKRTGNKTVYIVAVLGERYNICERKVYKVLKRMQQDCQIDTAG